jgi:heme-degrading monooxygenase HmoA
VLVYMVERVYRDGRRPSSVLSIWSTLDRAQDWAQRNAIDDGESHVAIRVHDVEVSAAAAS